MQVNAGAGLSGLLLAIPHLASPPFISTFSTCYDDRDVGILRCWLRSLSGNTNFFSTFFLDTPRMYLRYSVAKVHLLGHIEMSTLEHTNFVFIALGTRFSNNRKTSARCDHCTCYTVALDVASMPNDDP